MSFSGLNDEEFSARLHEVRSVLVGLHAEADARQLLRLGGSLAIAADEVGAAVRLWEQIHAPAPKAWEFRKPDGSLGICSWCQKEQAVQPQPHESHGICQKHLAEMRGQIEQRRKAA